MKRTMTALCVGLMLVGCGKSPAPTPAARPVVVMTVRDGADGGYLAYSGEVRARVEADLGFRIAGKVIERRVNLGDSVHKGQVLARLDPQDVQLSAAAVAAQVKAAEADLALAKAEYERAQNLYAQKFVSGSVVDTRRSQFDAAQARLKQVQAQDSVSNNQVSYTTLVADRDGVVTTLPVEAGQVVAAGQLVARVADPSQREVLTWIPEGRVQLFKPGQAALVQIWGATDKTYQGVVREIAASADTTTRTYAVRISVPAADERMRLGATAGVGFAKTGGTGEVTVPLAALVRGAGNDAQVWVVGKGDVIEARKVEVASYKDDVVILKQGLAFGDKIVTVGAHTLTPGLKIKPVEQHAPVVLDVQR